MWVDSNRNGAIDPTELRVSGVGFAITWAGPDGQLGTSDDVQQTATSDADGNFSFPNLPAGRYRVDIDTGSLPTSLSLMGPASITVDLAAGQSVDLDSFPLASASIHGPAARRGQRYGLRSHWRSWVLSWPRSRIAADVHRTCERWPAGRNGSP